MNAPSSRLGVALTFALTAGAWSATIYVDDDACPGPGTGTLGDPYCSIQDAIDAALDGDQIEVAPGTYVGGFELHGYAITLYSAGGPGVTILDGNGTNKVLRCVSGEGPDTVIDGFTITGGSGTGSSGGGMVIVDSSPTVTNCILTGNSASGSGGAIYSSNGSPPVTNCTFVENTCGGSGGAVYASGGTPTFANCTFVQNIAGDFGGAMTIGSPAGTVTHCTLIGNTAMAFGGGGLYVSSGEVEVVNSLFRQNLTTSVHASMGSAIHVGDAAVKVINSTLAFNSGGDAVIGGHPLVMHLEFWNSISWYNDPATFRYFPPPTPGSIIATNDPLYSNYEGGGSQSNGNILAVPSFVDIDGADDILGNEDDDFRLAECSPCIDAGDSSLGGGATDLDGNPRTVDDAGVPDVVTFRDMGAYERQTDSMASPPVLVPGDFPTIQAAINATCPGNEVIVAPGTYVESINLNGRAITVRSSGGPDVTIIDGNGADHVVQCRSGEGPDTVLDGFTITGGMADGQGGEESGAGMSIFNSDPTVRNCFFTGNVATASGAGMYISGSSPVVDDCVFEGNLALNGAAIYSNSSAHPVVTNCTFAGNTATNAGGAVFNSGSEAMFAACIFDSNMAVQGGAMYNGETTWEDPANAKVTDCLFVGNAVDSAGAGVFNDGSSPTLINCVFNGNAAIGGGAGGGMFNTGGSDPIVTNCTFTANSAAGILAGGAMVNSEDSNPTVTGCIFRGNAPDEISNFGSGPLIAYSNVNGSGGSGGGWDTALGIDGGNNVDVDPQFVDPDGPDDIAGNDDDDVRLGRFSPCADAADESAIPIEITTDADGNPRFVDDPAVDDTGVGTPPPDMGAYERQGPSMPLAVSAGESIQDAIDAAYPIDGILVNPGTYNEAIDLAGKAIALRSAAGPHVTILDGNGAPHVVQAVNGEGPATVVEGFTITGGLANGAGDDANGAGMLVLGSSPRVINCIIRGSTASFLGGGMYNGAGSAPAVLGCLFSGNGAEFGGGVFNAGTAAPTFVNCTFNANSATTGQGMFNGDVTSPTVTNCIFWPDDLFSLASTMPAVTYSDVSGGHAGQGNIERFPRYFDADGADNTPGTADDDLSLGVCSEAIDAGDNAALPGSVTTDIDGNPRRFDDTGQGDTGAGTPPVVDMGAFERQAVSPITLPHVPADFLTIQDAIDFACYESAIIVDPGTYNETIDFKGKSVHLVAAGGPAVTIIDGGGALHVVEAVGIAAPGAMIEGFTITGGVAIGTTPDSDGGGIYADDAHLTLINCIVRGNSAVNRGAGVYAQNGSDVTFVNTVFNGNTALFGGGAYLRDGDSSIINSTFTANDATSGSGGGLATSNGDVTVQNSILWGNTGTEVWNIGGSGTYSYCLVPAAVGGSNNRDVEPRFVDADGADNVAGNADDDLRLDECSQVIDAGNNAALPAGVKTDAGGNPRYYDDTGAEDIGAGMAPMVDIGAYERQTNSLNPVYVPGNYASIQNAIDFVCENGTVIVDPGTYFGAINFNGKAVRLRSYGGPDVTTINGNGALHVVQAVNGEGPDTVIEGFTITGGVATGTTPDSDGAGMYLDGASPTVIDCIFRGNDADNRGGGAYGGNGSAPAVTNCTFTGNTGARGGGMYLATGSDATITNCSFTGNDATALQGGGLYTFDSDPVVTNSVLWGNGSGEVWTFGGSPVYAYCVVPAIVGGTGNLDVDPRFVDADGLDDTPGTADDDLRLDDCSPAADAGSNAAVPAGVIADLDGNPRFSDDTGVDDVGAGTPPLVDIGAYERQTDSPNPVYVPGDFASIQDALDFACDNGAVIVDPGTYVGAIDFNGRAVTLRSSGGAAVTTIDGGGFLHVVQAVSGEGPDTVLDGFTITGGVAVGTTPNSDGGGMYIDAASPTVLNCIFRGNSATNRGAGLYATNGSTPVVANCLFHANTAASGGGAYFRAGSIAAVTNCTFTGNDATSGVGGGVFTFNSDTVVTNCIVWGNRALEVGNLGGSPVYSYSVVPAIVGGTGNIDVDPLFLDADGPDDVLGTADDDLRLRRFSPCIDTGSNAAVPASGDPDLAGNPRFYDDTGIAPVGGPAPVDMGAYERQVDSQPGLILVPGDAPTIQLGIDIAINGDEVRVSPGTYVESIGFFGKAITVRSSGGPQVTTIDGNGAPNVVRCLNSEGPGTVLEGFTITGGNANGAFPNDRGGGMVNWCASPTVTDCIFTGNHASGFGGGIFSCSNAGSVTGCTFAGNTSGNLGGGMYSDTFSTVTVTGCTFTGNAAASEGGGMYNGTSSHATVSDCVFDGNNAGSGGGIANSGSDPAVIDCKFVGNTGTVRGGAMFNVGGSNPPVTSSTFIGNTSANGGGMYNNGSDPAVVNCTFYGNSATGQFGGGAFYNTSGSSPVVTNCVLWDDPPNEFAGLGSPAVTYCVVEGGHAGTGNVTADPMFVDADGADDTPGTSDDNLRTLPCSSTIDAGDNTAVPGGVTTDLDGNPRFIDDAGIVDSGSGAPPVVDIGAFERQGSSFPGGVVTVPGGFATIQAAIDGACDRGVIEVAAGTYLETIDFHGKRVTLRSADGPQVTIIDGAGAAHVVMCVGGEGSGTVLEGFTITGGNAAVFPDTSGAGMYIDGSSPTVIDCIFTGNSAGSGGGLYTAGGNPTVTDCVFAGNSAGNGAGMASTGGSAVITACVFTGNVGTTEGGAMRNQAASPTIVECVFEGNAAERGAGIFNISGSNATVTDSTFIGNVATARGAGIWNQGGVLIVTDCSFIGNQATDVAGAMNILGSADATVTQCMFTGNSAGDSGGAMRISAGTASLNSCTFAGNTAPDAGAIRLDGAVAGIASNCILWGNTPNQFAGAGSLTVQYSDVQGGFAGTGNIDADPAFLDADGPDDIPGTVDDDLRLRPCSPVTDAGLNAAVPVEVVTDLDGNARILDDTGVVDTGAGSPPLVDMGAYERQTNSISGGFTLVPDDYPTIQAAIDAACEGGALVLVGPGTHVGTIDFRGKAVSVRSSDGPEATVLDGGGVPHVVSFVSGEGPASILDGFTITGGNADGAAPDDAGGGVYVNGSSPKVVNCVLEGNSAARAGAGLQNAGGSPVVANCVFRGNTVGDPIGLGGGISNEGAGSATVINTVFSGNTAFSFGGGVYCDASASPTLFNCSFSNNTAGVNGGAIYNDSATMTVTNCILWDDGPDEVYNTSTPADVTYSLVGGGYAGTGNIDADPAFVDAEGPDNTPGTADDDLRLGLCSPATDAGENDPLILGVPIDLDDNLRFVDDAGMPDSGSGAAPLVDMGAYERQTDSFPGGTVTVPAEFASIQAAIDAACDRGEIVVAPGTYVGTIDFQGKALTVRSSDGPEVTILDGGGAPHVVQCLGGEGPNTVLEGFTITGGIAESAFPDDSGAGMAIGGSSPTVRDCIFVDNTASLGGAMVIRSGAAPMVIDCVFAGNFGAFRAGAMYIPTADPTIVNCTFSGNVSDGEGGAIYNWNAGPSFVNCTFTANAAPTGGAISNNSGSNPTVTNCIVWGNGPDEIFSAAGATPVVTYCDVLGGHAGTGNVDIDPMFADADGRLAPCSPVADAGDNAAVPAGVTTDFDGNARFIDDGGVADTGAGVPPLVDMGAFERQYSSFTGGSVTVPARYPTIQAAIDSACDRGEIVVEPGLYVETIDFKGKTLTLRSSGGAAVTTIDGGGAFHVVQFKSGEGPETVLDGFTITGGIADGAGNDARGAGIRIVNGSPTVINCIVRDNLAVSRGGAMYLSGSASTVTNCVFAGNTGTFQGGAVWASDGPAFVNCTFNGNFSTNGGAMLAQLGSTISVTNCVFRDNTVDTIDDLSSGGLVITHSNVEGGWPGTGNIDADPLFVDADGPDDVPGTDDDDLHLLPGSPSIETGDNTAVPAGITTDLDGNDRFFDADGDLTATVDMGPYESAAASCPWDCDGSDGDVGINDFLAVLAQWGQVGTACDFDGSGVGINDFLALLANWGPCP